MERLPLESHEQTGLTYIADTMHMTRHISDSWQSYLEPMLEAVDDMMAYETFTSRLGDMRSALVRLTADSPRGTLTLARRDIKEIVSANSLRHGFMFGMMINEELLVGQGVVSRMALDRLAPYVSQIFDDILATSSSSSDLIWTFRLYGENLYLNTLAHPDSPQYHMLNNQPDPIKPLIDSICDELYPAPEDPADFLGYERRDADTLNFRHGFAIARRACNSYLLETE